MKLTVRVPDTLRTAEEFSTLDSRIWLKLPFSVPGIRVLSETFPTDSLGACANVSVTTDTLRTFQLYEDFATINFKAAKLFNFAIDSTGQVLAPAERSSPERLTTTRLEQLARQLHDDRIYLATTPEFPFMRLGFHIAATYGSVG